MRASILASLTVALITSGCLVLEDDGLFEPTYTTCDSYGCWECDDWGQCEPVDIVACTEDAHCPTGDYCWDGACVYGGTCDAGLAQISCPHGIDCQVLDAGCGDGFACDSSGTCVPVDRTPQDGDPSGGGGGGTCPNTPPPGASCACASDCATGQYCEDGQCRGEAVVGPGDHCTYDGECAGGRCTGGRCQSACTSHNQCGTGDRCLSGHCQANPSPAVECVFSVDCDESAVCINATCHTTCDSDDDCPVAADFCDQGACRPDWRRVSECTFKSDCDAAEDCVDGQCRTSCEVHQECATCVDGPNCVLGYCQE